MDEQVLQEGVANEEDESSTCGSTAAIVCVDFTSAFTTDMIFNSRKELIEWIRDTGKKNGMITIIKKSDVGAEGRRPRITFACERSGAYRRKYNEGQTPKRPKRMGTKKCNCPFELKGHKLDGNDDWILKVVCGVHNHPITQQSEGHSFAGRLTEQEANILIDMSKSNLSPKEILNTLKQRDAHNASTIKAIYNARHKYKVGEQIGREHMQKLMNKLTEYKYIEWHRSDEENQCIKDLFWAHPFAVGLLRAYPSVLIMDCTYEISRYPFPLLEIVGATCTELTFPIAFAYLEFDREDNYTWALERLRSMMEENILPSVIVTDKDLTLMHAIHKVFPRATNLLCRWHISRDVLANCKKFFETKESLEAFICSWNELVLSATEQEYMQHLSTMEDDFPRYPQVLDYVKQTWLVKYKEKFVAAWTDLTMHFGNVTMNRDGTIHAKLKRHLGAPLGNFDTSWKKMHTLLELQHSEIKASFDRSLTIVQHNFKAPIFEELRGFVSINAMNMILAESERANSIGLDASACVSINATNMVLDDSKRVNSVVLDASACGCALRHTHGIPCAHEIAMYKREGRPIPLSSVHPHWKKLKIVPVTQNTTLELRFKAEVEMLVKRFNEADGLGKVQLLKKLKELANPSSTLHAECVINSQDQAYLDDYTDYDSSEFEDALSTEDSHSEEALLTSSTTSMQEGEKDIHPIVSLQAVPFIDSFPVGLRPYIHDVRDVTADGHCGFRVVADLIGMGENNWAQVKRDLVDELQSHYDDYVQLYGGADRVQELLHSLSYFHSGSVTDNNMTMPDTGHIIASRYNIVLLHISQQQCITFLPLRSVPLPRTSHKVIAIGFVNECQFVEVFMYPGSPMPPIASNWFKHCNPCAQGWETPYKIHIKAFRDLMCDHSKC